MAKTNVEGSKARAADRGGAAFGIDIPEGDGPLLSDPTTVEGLVRQFYSDVLDVRKAYNGGMIKGPDATAKIKAHATALAAIFMGNNPDYSFTDWNSAEQLGEFIHRINGVDQEKSVEAFLLRLSADFVDQAVVPFEDDKIDMETVTFRMDAAIEDATYSLLGLENPATENE